MYRSMKVTIKYDPQTTLEIEVSSIAELRHLIMNEIPQLRKVNGFVTHLENKAAELPEHYNGLMKLRDSAIRENEIFELDDNIKHVF